jgi:hypothetical protein
VGSTPTPGTKTNLTELLAETSGNARVIVFDAAYASEFFLQMGILQ